MIMKTAGKLLEHAFYCHRLPERSFFIAGYQLPVCSRCTGILIGYLSGIYAINIGCQVSFHVPLLLSVPLVIDGFGQHFGRWKSNNLRRLVTGILFGFSLFILVKLMAVMGYCQGQRIGIAIKTLISGGSL